MFCANCGTQIPDNAGGYCPNCSQGIEREDKKGSRVVREFSEMFVSDDEWAKKAVGGGYIDNWLQFGGLSKGFGVVTNRRLYYKGKCFHKLGGNYVKTDEECIVDLQDITSSGFTHTKHLWLLFAAIASIITGIFVANATDKSGDGMGVFLAFLFVSVLLLAAYFIFRLTMYTVTFAGGSLSIKASSFGVKELKAFDKVLHQAKDEHLQSMR